MLHVIPGSGNLIGGQGLLVKVKPGRSLDEMKLPEAPATMKMALGENPKGIYGGRHQSPATRMGNFAVLRQAFTAAGEYAASWERYRRNIRRDSTVKPPERDLKLEALQGVLSGETQVHMHCYRADEMLRMIDMAKRFGFRITCYHHAVEAWMIADELAEHGVAAAVWPDWWGFKLEAWNARLDAPVILKQAGAVFTLHSDSARDVQWLYHMAARLVRYGLDETSALESITTTPAEILGLEERVGSLAVGRDADVTVFDRHPLDIYTRVAMTIVDGEILYERTSDEAQDE
ncbi:MAG: amidohydrolase family protein [Candidatus Eisenbacteria bacterium]|nr:amidohydrolase family protein [Candidatus Eisenbacteria bacterium]